MSACLACHRLELQARCASRAAPALPLLFGAQTRGAKRWVKLPKRRKVVAGDSGPLSEVIRMLQVLHPLRPDVPLDLTIEPALAKTVNANSLKGRMFLPHDVPKDASAQKETIAVIVEEGPDADLAKRMGADFVGTDELVTRMIEGLVLPSKLLCHPDALPLLTRNPVAARTLGPKGLMPSARRGTVSADIAKMIQDARGALDWAAESDTSANGRHFVRALIGRAGMEREAVERNVQMLVDTVGEVALGRDASKEATSEKPTKKLSMKRGGIREVVLSTGDGFRIAVT